MIELLINRDSDTIIRNSKFKIKNSSGERQRDTMVEERSMCVEAESWGLVEYIEVRMLAWVAWRQVRILPTVNLRVPGQRPSSQG